MKMINTAFQFIRLITLFSLALSCLFSITTTLKAANASPRVHFALVATDATDATKKNTTRLCTFQYIQPAAGCKKITLQKKIFFHATDLQYVELQRPPSLTLSNAYNEQSTMMPGKIFEDIKIHFVFKENSLKKITRLFNSAQGNQLAVVINNEAFLVSDVTPFSGNDYIVAKKMDVVLARHIVDAITLARQQPIK